MRDAASTQSFLDSLPIDPQRQDRSMLADMVRSTYQQNRVALLGHILGIVVFTAIMWNQTDRQVLSTWAALFCVLWLIRFWQQQRFDQAMFVGTVDYACWGLSYNVTSYISAAFWAMAVLFFYQDGENFHRVSLMLMIYTYGMGSVPYMVLQWRSFIARTSLYFVPLITAVALVDESHHLELAGIWVLMWYGTLRLGKAYRHVFVDMVKLRLQTEDLATQLQSERDAADGARHQAELANRSKTQFFAAASHDLRQPLHAMGLFAEALRQRIRDEEVIHLVNSINSSVDALEGLFSELLDITKIDSGNITVEPEHFAVRDLFARLRLTFEPTAFEKGLELRFRGDNLHCYADPLLVERILRNLIANSIRYTENGGILVSCRRHGSGLLLQVWDTGIGIADSALPRIFEEFYQVQTTRPLEPHHRKGLGLGLAIVKRLAALMHAPLTVQSRVGRGTVFNLELPAGKAPRLTAMPAQSKAPLALTLHGKSIVIVEDEPAVKEGLEVLLKGWGARVDSFDTVARVQAWASDAPYKPDLILVDFRLPEQQTGIDAVRAVREKLGPLPAIMITGSTMIGHEDEARKHDLHILLKPVIPTKLRAMIAFKLGVRG